MTSNTLKFSKHLPITKKYDLIVCGGGPAGTTAAIAAKRAGLNVLLVESQGQLGGMGVSGLVSHWLGGRMNDCERWAVGGIFKKMAHDAYKQGFALLPDQDIFLTNIELRIESKEFLAD